MNVYASAIKNAGQVVTLSRVEILRAIHRNGAMSAPDLFTMIETRVPGITLRSLYNTLARMQRGDLVTRIERDVNEAAHFDTHCTFRLTAQVTSIPRGTAFTHALQSAS